MWSLDSTKWATLSTFFGDPSDLPGHLRRWQDALGTSTEEDVYADFYECFLHQATITDAAYAVVPYIVEALDQRRTKRVFDYVTDLGLIEANRLTPHSPKMPEGLDIKYADAIARAQSHAVGLLSVDRPKPDFRYLLCAIAGLYGHPVLAFILFHLDCITGECANCGEQVYPEEIQKSGY